MSCRQSLGGRKKFVKGCKKDIRTTFGLQIFFETNRVADGRTRDVGKKSRGFRSAARVAWVVGVGGGAAPDGGRGAGAG